jgi:hypothetical protein
MAKDQRRGTGLISRAVSAQPAAAASTPEPERRDPTERRSRTLRSLVVGSFHPRRRGPRRTADASLASTDLHDARWLAVALLILILSIADALLTLTLLNHGALETNPVMGALLHGDGHGFAAIKIGLTATGVVLLTLLVRVRAFGRLPVSTLLYGVLAVYTMLVCYELWLLKDAIAAT